MVSQESKTSSRSSETDGLEGRDEARLKRGKRRERKARPLDEVGLRDLALSYVARFATTGAKLEAYLARKLRERGVAEDADGRTLQLDVAALTARLVELGYVDDAAYARAKAGELRARGYGARRVEQALWAAGVEESLRSDNAPGEAASRRAAMLLASRRRFGPYGAGAPDDSPDARRKLREKQVAAMLRAGHSFDHARFIIDAAAIADIEIWLEEARLDDREECEPW